MSHLFINTSDVHGYLFNLCIRKFNLLRFILVKFCDYVNNSEVVNYRVSPVLSFRRDVHHFVSGAPAFNTIEYITERVGILYVKSIQHESILKTIW